MSDPILRRNFKRVILKLSGEARAIIAKTAAEANFKVTLKWKSSDA